MLFRATTLGRLSGRSEERRGGEEGRCRCDWSSDVCSSDLPAQRTPRGHDVLRLHRRRFLGGCFSGLLHSGASREDRKSVVEGKRGDVGVIGVQMCALPISLLSGPLGAMMFFGYIVGDFLGDAFQGYYTRAPLGKIGRASWRGRGEM